MFPIKSNFNLDRVLKAKGLQFSSATFDYYFFLFSDSIL